MIGRSVAGLAGAVLVAVVLSRLRRHDLGHLPSNLLLVARALAGSFVVVLAACAVGRRLLGALRFDVAPALALPVSAALGAAVLSAAGTVLAFTGLVHEWTVAGVVLLALLLSRPAWGDLAADVTRAARDLAGARPEGRWLAALAAFIWLRELGWYLRAPADTDTLSYHLTVLQDVLRDHAATFNHFAHQGGFSLGWHFYALFAYVIGGARGATTLVAWFVAGTCYLVFVMVSRRTSPVVGAVGACLAAVLIALVQGHNNHTTNDVPLVFLELCGLLLALGQAGSGSLAARAALTGLLLGFAVGVKVNSVGTAAFGLAALAWSIRPVDAAGRGVSRRVAALLIAGLCAAPLASVWPVRAWVAVGAPLPHAGVVGGTARMTPQQAETVGFHVAADVQAFRDRAVAALTDPPAALLIVGVGLVLAFAYRRAAAFADVFAFAGFRWLTITVLTLGGYAFHPRYHLTSTLALGMAAAGGWSAGLRARVWDHRSAIAWAGLALVLTSFSWRALLAETKTHVHDALLLPAEARGSHAGVFRWVSENLPADARLAGEAVETFYSHRRYLQIQPAAQGQIDLAGSPAEILGALRSRGVTHIHLSPHLDIPPANEPLVRKWLTSFAAIPDAFNLAPLYDQAGERIYDIRSVPTPNR